MPTVSSQRVTRVSADVEHARAVGDSATVASTKADKLVLCALAKAERTYHLVRDQRYVAAFLSALAASAPFATFS